MISPIRDTFIIVICASLIFILIVLLSLLAEIKSIKLEAVSINETLTDVAIQQAIVSNELSLLNESLSNFELIE